LFTIQYPIFRGLLREAASSTGAHRDSAAVFPERSEKTLSVLLCISPCQGIEARPIEARPNVQIRRPEVRILSVGHYNCRVMSDVASMFHARLGDAEREYVSRLRVQIDRLQSQLLKAPEDAQTRVALAAALEKSGESEGGLRVLLEGMTGRPPEARIYFASVIGLCREGRTEEALRLAGEACVLFPENIEFRLARELMLPVIYGNTGEIAHYRERFIAGMKVVDSGQMPDARTAVAGLQKWDNFFLAYQGMNDLDLQKQYGEFVARIMSEAFPGQPTRPLGALRKQIRVGFVSAHMFSQTVAGLFLGWITNLDRDQFEVFSYHAGANIDEVTDQFRAASEHYFQSTGTAQLIDRLRADQLDVIVYLDVGMSSRASQLAGLRLAPVQCATWGHPVTTGLPTVDYFLSSDLMEPEGAEAHYSETLVRLPGISVCYDRPLIMRSLVRLQRKDFGLRDDAIVYLCCQSSFKYLPHYDHVFAAIAHRVPGSQFVFIVKGKHIADVFRGRLRAEFRSLGLSMDDHCVFIPPQYHFRYLSLNMLSDVFLDSIGWSGGNTTLEALACNLPVVTLPGEFMRGRHSYAMLRHIGLTDTIAESISDYIGIAARLGTDDCFRREIGSRIRINAARLYRDTSCVRGLELFFQQAISAYSAAPLARASTTVPI
jgi:protein O-GlcNAc transferase